MSENPSTGPSPTPAPNKKAKGRRTWKQRLKITTIILVVGGLLIRIGLNYLLPTVVRKVANAYDLDCTYDRMSLGLISGNAHIWNLELRPKSGGDSIVHADYIQGSISTPNLFRGRLVVYRAEVDGVDLLIDRQPDGSISLLRRFLSPPADSPIAMEPAVSASATTQPVNLQAPLRIDALRVSHVTTTFRDRSVTPVFQTTIRTSVRLSDVGSSGSPARFELQVAADPVLDALIVEGVMRNTPTTIDADLNVVLRGLHLKPAEGYLVPLGLRPLADDITVKAKAKLTASVVANSTDVAGRLLVSDVSATVDSSQWASLKTLSLNAKRLNPSSMQLERLLIENGRASARRSAEGRLQIAGLELVPAVSSAGFPEPATAPAAPQIARSAAPPVAITLDELRLVDLEASFDDQAVQPAGQLAARLEEMTAKDIQIAPADPNTDISFGGKATVPGAIRSITWTGRAKPFGVPREAGVEVRADGIKPDALRPYLDALGVQSDFVAGAFAADVDVRHEQQRISATIANVRLTDGQARLLDLSSAVVTGLSVNPADGAIQVAAVDLAGPTLTLRRESDGSLAALGLRTKTTGRAVASEANTATTAAPPLPARPIATQPANAPAKLPRLQVDRLTWKDIRLVLEDRFGVEKPVMVEGRAGMEARDLTFDPSTTQPPAKPGQFSGWIELPGVAESLSAKGSLQATRKGAHLTSEFGGQGITGSVFASYLKSLGIELALTDGRIHGRAGGTVTFTDQETRVDADLADITWSDGRQELAGVDAVRVTGVAIKPGDIGIGQVHIIRPRGRVTRHANGALEAGGVRLVPPPPSTQPALPQPPTPAPPSPLRLPESPVALGLKQFRLENGSLQVIDRTVNPVLDTVVRGSVTLENASLHGRDARLSVTGGLAGIVDNATVQGTLSLATDAPGAKLVITADKIRGDALAGYIPPGVTSTLRDGHFRMTLDAALANHAQGGIAGQLAVSDLLLHDEADNATLAKVGAFTVRVGRVDPVADVIAVDEVSSAGVEVGVARRPDGAIDALGIRLGGASASSSPQAAEAAQASGPAASATQPAVVATTQPAADVAALVADARRALPLFTLGKVDLKLDRLRLSGLPSPNAAPLEARLRLHNTGPVELAGPDAGQRPPLKLQVDGALDPVIRQFAVAIEATPFAAEPALTVEVNASGINGKGLTDVVPELANQINGEGLTEGRFVARLTGSLNYGRRGPRDLELARGFTAMFSVKPVEFRGEPDGPVLAGLEEIRGDGIKVQPKAGNVTIKSIEVLKPIGRFVRDDQGLHALGLVIPLKRAAPATQPAEASASSPSEPARATAPPASTGRPLNEIRLDRFTVTGIDLLFEDRTSMPSTLLPLRTLDLEVRDISNQMLWTGRPMQFDMLVTSDKVPLPPRKGAAGPTTQPGGMEMRELFSQVTASGRIGLKQSSAGRATLTGWAKTSVNGFELLGVRGLAEAQKVTIGGGVFDDSNDIRFKDDGTIETRNKVVFTNLVLSEDPDSGPLRRLLKLPAPIDLAIGAVKDADDSITMNLPVTVESGEVDVGKAVAPAIAAVSQVLVTAIASAPIKVVGGVGGMLGVGGKEKAPEPPVELTFLPGVTTLEPAQARKLALLADRMRRDDDLELQLRHEMSPADVAHLEGRANPPAADVRLMVDRLRRNKSQLSSDRAVLAARATAQFAAQSAEAEQSVQNLRAIDRRLAQIDTSLDQLGDLLRPGASAQADRRTRVASLTVAKERFDLIHAAIIGAAVPDAANRVRRTNPQYEPVEILPRGRVVITLVPKKK